MSIMNEWKNLVFNAINFIDNLKSVCMCEHITKPPVLWVD